MYLTELPSAIANRGRFVGCDPLQQAVGCWRQLLSSCPLPDAQPGPGLFPIPGAQLSLASLRDSFVPPCKPWLCWSLCSFTEALQRQASGLCKFGRGLLSSAGGSRGPPDKRAWLGFSVWQAAPELCRSYSGDIPNHAREWHRGRSCNMMPLKPSAARESKAYGSSWGH